MNFLEALQFPFQDKNWVNKFVITVILLIIPILGWIVLSGYVVRVVRNRLNGINDLPEYEDFGADFTRGVMVFIGSLVYYLPSIILSCCNGIIGNDDGAVNAIGCLLNIVQFGYGLLITPLLMSAIARYAVSEDMSAFLDFGGRINDLTSHTNELIMLYLHLFLFYIVGGIAIGIGFVLCCIPGLIMWAAVSLGYAYFIAEWGKVLGVGGTDMTVPTGTI